MNKYLLLTALSTGTLLFNAEVFALKKIPKAPVSQVIITEETTDNILEVSDALSCYIDDEDVVPGDVFSRQNDDNAATEVFIAYASIFNDKLNALQKQGRKGKKSKKKQKQLTAQYNKLLKKHLVDLEKFKKECIAAVEEGSEEDEEDSIEDGEEEGIGEEENDNQKGRKDILPPPLPTPTAPKGSDKRIYEPFPPMP
jgi:hypothetical protein